MDNKEFFNALRIVEKENGIDKSVILEAIEASLISACKKDLGNEQNVIVDINEEKEKITVYTQKTVVEEVEDESLEMSLIDAKRIKYSYQIGDIVDIEVIPKDFGRISAQTAKQVVVQKFREAEREILFEEYIEKEKDITTGIVQRIDRNNIIIELGKIDAMLPPNEQIPGEEYKLQDRIKIYVTEVKQTTKGPRVFISRTHPDLVKRLFEQEVPEIHDGIVEIKNIAREAGSRSKMAVYSNDENVDPVGACVGPNGYRVNLVVDELNGEKIDVIRWNEDPKIFIKEALSPSKILAVELNEEEHSAKVVVPDHQLSLSIGKEGQNARLSAKLTGWKIDISSLSQAKELGLVESNEDEQNALVNELNLE